MSALSANRANEREPLHRTADRSGAVALLLLAASVRLTGQTPPATVTPYQESVTVDRIVVNGRVIDRFASTVPGLRKENFRLRVDGVPVPIESVEYASTAENTSDDRGESPPPSDGLTAGARAASWIGGSSRLIAILFQWEIAGQKDEGFVRVMRQAIRFIETANPSDQISVLGYGSSLRLISDFSTNRSVARQAVLGVRSLRTTFRSPEGEPTIAPGISRCGSTDSIEKALICVGRSLRDIEGPKVLLFCGWAAESHRSSWRTEYPDVIDAITNSQTSFFALDVSNGAHRLAAGLRRLANDTGGLYSETFDFPDLARLRLRKALEGTYEIVFRNPGVVRGWHTIEIDLVNARGIPLFRRWYND